MPALLSWSSTSGGPASVLARTTVGSWLSIGSVGDRLAVGALDGHRQLGARLGLGVDGGDGGRRRLVSAGGFGRSWATVVTAGGGDNDRKDRIGAA
jgi:hypothetical protein